MNCNKLKGNGPFASELLHSLPGKLGVVLVEGSDLIKVNVISQIKLLLNDDGS